jgi:hypothetical protein
MAYYEQVGKTVCGVHSKELLRTKLPVNPNKGQNDVMVLAEHNKSIADAAAMNLSANLKGQVVCYKMAMMKNPSYMKYMWF